MTAFGSIIKYGLTFTILITLTLIALILLWKMGGQKMLLGMTKRKEINKIKDFIKANPNLMGQDKVNAYIKQGFLNPILIEIAESRYKKEESKNGEPKQISKEEGTATGPAINAGTNQGDTADRAVDNSLAEQRSIPHKPLKKARRFRKHFN